MFRRMISINTMTMVGGIRKKYFRVLLGLSQRACTFGWWKTFWLGIEKYNEEWLFGKGQSELLV
jgi:hypothetical protein